MSRQDPKKLESKFWRTAKASDSTQAFANKLFEGASRDADALDALIVQHARNWAFGAHGDNRFARVAPGPIYELRTGETPPKVILNEAVDLAKKFSSEDAGSFVNGILDAVHAALVASQAKSETRP